MSHSKSRYNPPVGIVILLLIGIVTFMAPTLLFLISSIGALMLGGDCEMAMTLSLIGLQYLGLLIFAGMGAIAFQLRNIIEMLGELQNNEDLELD